MFKFFMFHLYPSVSELTDHKESDDVIIVTMKYGEKVYGYHTTSLNLDYLSELLILVCVVWFASVVLVWKLGIIYLSEF